MDNLLDLDDEEGNPRRRWKIVCRTFSFGYQKGDDPDTFMKKTTYSLTPYTVVADPDLPEAQYVGFRGFTEQVRVTF